MMLFEVEDTGNLQESWQEESQCSQHCSACILSLHYLCPYESPMVSLQGVRKC